jgi:hypothetical protein
MKDMKWLKSPWSISIGTAILSLFLTMIYDYFKKQPMLSTVWQVLEKIWAFIVSVLNFNIKVWWLIIGLIFLISIIYLIDKLKQGETSNKPDFFSYKEGKFKRWKWTWNWEWNCYKNAWFITDLTPHCPNCDTPLVEGSTIYQLKYICPRCDFTAEDSQCDEAYKIERIILDNIERKRRGVIPS